MTSAFDDFTYTAFPVEKYDRFLDTYVTPYAGPIGTALDLGCGSGVLVERLASRFAAPARLLGVDISKAAIAACRARSGLPTERVRFVQADVSGLDETPEHRAAFDLVTSYSVLHFVPGDTERKLRSLARLTKPGAIVAVDALAANAWNRVMFGLVKLLIRTRLWSTALRILKPVVGPTFPEAFMEELARMTYLKDLRYRNFIDVSALESERLNGAFELLKLDVVPQDGFLTGRKVRFTLRRQ